MWRYEKKHLVLAPSTAILSGITKDLNRHHPSAIIEDIYFDTPDFQCYQWSQDGELERLKVRLRHYSFTDSPWLEIKVKRGELGRKVRCKWLDSQNISAINRWVHQQVSIGLLTPVCRIRYRRAYWVSHTGIRVTVDEHLEAAYLNGAFTPINPNAIVEYKYTPNLQPLAATLPLENRVEKVSKYETAIGALYPVFSHSL